MKYKLHNIEGYWVVSSDVEIDAFDAVKDNCYYVWNNTVFWREYSHHKGGRLVIASNNPHHNFLPSIHFSTDAAAQLGINVLELGNRISVTTLYDLENRRDYPNRDEYVNMGKQTYIGNVVKCAGGLGLNTDDGLIFPLQGTYWFGSILDQNVKLVRECVSGDVKKFTLEDIKRAIEVAQSLTREKSFIVDNWGDPYVCFEDSKKEIEKYIQSITTKEYVCEILVDECGWCDGDGIYVDADSNTSHCGCLNGHFPKITNNTIIINNIK